MPYIGRVDGTDRARSQSVMPVHVRTRPEDCRPAASLGRETAASRSGESSRPPRHHGGRDGHRSRSADPDDAEEATPMNVAGVNTNLLVSLNPLPREPNVFRAAEAVGLTQSSMSHALAQLRAHFGDRLLVPSGRRMVLTERRRALVESAGPAVAHVERVFAPVSGFDPATSDRTSRTV